MASEKQLAANKLNAEKAGVKTDEGKKVVRHNAFKHGLTSKTLLSDFRTIKETQEILIEIYESLCESLNPTNTFQASLIEKMALAQFKMRRLDVWETTLFKEDLDFLDKKWTFEVKDDNQFELALKYKQSLEAQYYRALTAFNQSKCSEQQMDLFFPAGDSRNE